MPSVSVAFGRSSARRREDDVELAERPQAVEYERQRGRASNARPRDVRKALPGIHAVDRGRFVQVVRDRLQRREQRQVKKGYAFQMVGTITANSAVDSLEYHAMSAVDQPGRAQQVVGDAERRVEQPQEHDADHHPGHRPGQQHEAAQPAAEREDAVEEQRRAEADAERRQDRAERVDERHPRAVPRRRIGQHRRVVAEAQRPAAEREEVEAAALAQADREDQIHRIGDQREHRDDGRREQPVREQPLARARASRAAAPDARRSLPR
jgi:hypothetical protein